MSKPEDSTPTPPSLLSAESRGGDINEGGLDFQMAVLMTYLPRWLAMEGFTMLIREASGDFEVKFFAPGHGYVREFLESKDHSVTPRKILRLKSNTFRSSTALLRMNSSGSLSSRRDCPQNFTH